jgi:prepilin-type N-terminal cleavage/methylation domain-containing protein
VRRARGFTVIEVVTALAVLAILVTAAIGGEEGHKRSIARAFSDLEAHLAASGRLETVREGLALRPGAHDVDLGLEGLRARETVTRLADGLHEVRVVVRGLDDTVLADLATLVLRESAP